MHSYHHGDLRQALLEATDAVLAERGAEGFSLREVARRAGVTPAAPAHHFGSAAGLLTAVATQGFEGLAKALREGDARGGKEAAARLREQGIAYVRFAARHPGRFRLMFSGTLHQEDAALQAAGQAAFSVLEEGVRLAFGETRPHPTSTEAMASVLALWSTVHGCAHLLIADRLEPCAGGLGRERFLTTALPPMLESVIAGCIPAKAKKKKKPARKP